MGEQPRSRQNSPKAEDAAVKRSAGVSPARFPALGAHVRTRGYLPHWEIEGATYFVTFRLADSLPDEVLRQIRFDREDIPATAAQNDRQSSETERRRLVELHTRQIERYLDTGAGACFLRSHAVAGTVADSLRRFHGTRYELFAWCIMPNHVHVIFRALGVATLAEILQSWKSFSAKEGNRILYRSGEFWQREYYGRLIRNEAEFLRLKNTLSPILEGRVSKDGLGSGRESSAAISAPVQRAGETPALRRLGAPETNCRNWGRRKYNGRHVCFP